MRKHIWITLIGCGFLVIGVPDRARAQDNGLGPRMLGPAPPFGPIQRLLYGRRPDLAAAALKAAGRYEVLGDASTSIVADVSKLGNFTTFDVPEGVNGTYPVAINPAGVIAGYYYDANFASHGFLRGGDGSIVTFDAPEGVNGTNIGGLNAAGAITGSYGDASGVFHGFLRAPDGTFTTFDPPDDVNGTYPFSINPAGAIAGLYYDANFGEHGFLRARDGTITTFNVPNGGSTAPTAINPNGTITGAYFQPISGNPFGGNWRGFVRAPGGAFTTFDAATYSPCCIWTFVLGINPEGAVAGYLNDGHNLNRAFRRAPDGTVTLLDAPGAGRGGTIAVGISPSGVITGYYYDANSVAHGFVLEAK